MSVARHHNEWLSLVETSGPFLSLPVLLRVFPQGLDSRDASQAGRLRESYEDWLERGAKDPSVHTAWIRGVLTDVLGYPGNLLAEGQTLPAGLEAVMATYGETLRPDLALKGRANDQKPALLVCVYPPNQDLEKPVAGKFWKASPGTRMMELLHAADVPVGLVTNGEEWMLVSARRNETTGFASWYADLWMQEPLTLRAFHSLLHLRRLIGVADTDTLPSLLLESSRDQQEVTDQLGYQVRKAVEVLVQAFDRIDAESGRTLLADVDPKTLYDGALTVMMRLVFLFSAEERGLLLLGDPFYDQNYAVSTLSEILRERADQHGEEVLERRHDSWCRLLATFRAVHGGVEHEAMRLPPYGGTLFDPDRYPFLEGRVSTGNWKTEVAKPLLINNRVALHLLEALQVLRVKVPGGAAETRRLSFSALDIEQIGHVYEGLLDHTAKRADVPLLGLAGSQDKEPEIPLDVLEGLARKGSTALIDALSDKTGKSDKGLKRLLAEPATVEEAGLLRACGQDEELARRVRPFAALLRSDSFGQLVVIHAGSVYVTDGTDRRRSGTHYTPRTLTEPMIRHTLEPLVYEGPLEGLPQEAWTLNSPKQILALKVCDMAMGSGAFLVEACRYLAYRLVESWENTERMQPGSVVSGPEGHSSLGIPSERVIPSDPAERLAVARRYVADRCLYGVDVNPMAVEMAKLSLWLVTLQRERPFTFLDHSLKHGDSLLGVSSLRQIENFGLRPGEQQGTLATSELVAVVQAASAKRRELEELPSNDYSQIMIKSLLHREAEAATATAKAVADELITLELQGLDGKAYIGERVVRAEFARQLLAGHKDERGGLGSPGEKPLATGPDRVATSRPTFHWPLEFPEVFAHGGFDVCVGNPPFMAGKSIGTNLSDGYSHCIKRTTSAGKGAADLCAYFFLRARQLSPGGFVGLLATNTIAQGETLRVGLMALVESGSTIFRALSSFPWQGAAAVHVSVVHFTNRAWLGSCVLDGVEVTAINMRLIRSGGRFSYAA